MSKIYSFTAASYADIQINPEGSPNRMPRGRTTLVMVRDSATDGHGIQLGTKDSTGAFVAFQDRDANVAEVDVVGESITVWHARQIDLYLHCDGIPTGTIEVKCGA